MPDTTATILNILQVFETGGFNRFGTIARAKGDRGGLSCGILQASIASGALGTLLRSYIDNGGQFIHPGYADIAEARDESRMDANFDAQFKAAAADPVMQQTQIDFFSQNYIQPAADWCARKGLTQPLTLAIVADSMVHGAFRTVKDLVGKQASEEAWAEAYVNARREWLASSDNELLRRTVYRPDTFIALIQAGNWSLESPVFARGVQVA